MTTPNLTASLRLDLYGNLMSQCRVFAGRLNQLSASGSRSMAVLSKAAQMADRGIDRLTNRYTAAVTGIGTAMAVKNVSSLQMRLTRLGIQAERSDKDMERLNTQINRVAQQRDINVDPSEIIAAIEKIVSKTGDMDFAVENMENLAYTIQAAGAAGEDVGAMVGDIYQKFGIDQPEKIRVAISKLVNQGKMGAFELKDLATQGERLMSAYAATGRIGQISLDEMGALAQMARQSTGSPEQTTTAIEALIRNFNDRTRQKMLSSAGIKLFDDDDPNKMRSVIDIVKDLVRLTNGSQTKISGVLDEEAMKAVRAVIIEYNKTKDFKSLDSFLKASSDSAALLQDAARAASKFDPNITKMRATFREFIYSKMERSLNSFARAVNSIDHEKMQRYLNNTAKILVGVGTALAAYKTAKFGFGVYSFFKNPMQAVRGGVKGGALGSIASMSAPLPVYVVNAGALGAAGGDFLGGGSGKSGKFGRVGRFMARHRGLARAVGYGSKFLKYGGRALGGLGVAYSAYELTKAENATQVGGSLGSIAGGLIGAIGGPLGMVAGAYIGNYLGEKIGSFFDDVPQQSAAVMRQEAEKSVNRSETKVQIGFEEPSMCRLKVNSIQTDDGPDSNTDVDLSLGGRQIVS